jgi:hypothetical protein
LAWLETLVGLGKRSRFAEVEFVFVSELGFAVGIDGRVVVEASLNLDRHQGAQGHDSKETGENREATEHGSPFPKLPGTHRLSGRCVGSCYSIESFTT